MVHNIRAHERREFERRDCAVVHENRLGRRRAIGIREDRHDAGTGDLVGKLDQRLREVEQEPLLAGLIDGPYAHEGCRRKHHELGSLVGRSSSELDHALSDALELSCRGPHLGNRNLHAWTFPCSHNLPLILSPPCLHAPPREKRAAPALPGRHVEQRCA